MSDQSGPERYQEFYKFIATVDAAGLVAALTLRRDLELEAFSFWTSMLCFGVSAYLCMFGMFWIAREQYDSTNLYDWLAVLLLSFTSIGITSVIGGSISG